MSIRHRWLAAGTAAAAVFATATTFGAGVASATPVPPPKGHQAKTVSPDIGRVTTRCPSRTDLLRIFSDATTCWADAGAINVRLYNNVYEWCAGNNDGYLVTSDGVFNLSRWHCNTPPNYDSITVEKIVIYGE